MKNTLLLLSIFVLSARMICAQEMMMDPVIPETQGSVRKMGSAYVFGTETDAISAGSIYDLNRSYFSLGHTPSNASYAMSVFDLGVAINPSMFLGIAGGFNISETKNEMTLPDNTTKTTIEKPSFFSTIAFGLNKKFGFHYNIAGATVETGINNNFMKSETEKSVWLHQVSFAMRISPNLKYTIPVGVVINNNQKTTDITDITDITTTTRIEDANKVILFLNPNFTLYPNSGVLSEFKAGVEVDFAVYNDMGQSKTTTPDATATTDKNTDTQDVLLRLYATPKFSWSFLNNQFRCMAEPTVAFLMRGTSNGKAADSSSAPVTTTYTISPSISAPVGAAFKPVDWFEFRSGLLYSLGGDILNTYTTGSTRISEYDLSSFVLAFAGFGFIIATDFFLDVAFKSGLNEFNLDDLSLQLTYNFK